MFLELSLIALLALKVERWAILAQTLNALWQKNVQVLVVSVRSLADL